MQASSIFLGSSQWNYSQFRLQLILSHPNIEIMSISKNTNIKGFLDSKESFFKIDAAIDVSQDRIDQINNLKNNNKKGCIFKCGRIQQQCRLQDGLGNPKIYRILLFKIAVKNLIPIYQSTSITKDDIDKITEEYDSVYLSTKSQQISVYDHQYYLRSTTQYVWQYDIEYRYLNANQPASKIRRWNPQSKKCSECQLNTAYWYCIQEKLSFCRDCFDETHKARSRYFHQKQPISPFNCHKKCHKTAHNQNILEFYCLICKDLKCTKCLSDPNHSLNRYSPTKGSISRLQPQLALHRNRMHEFGEVREIIKMLKQKQSSINFEIKEKVIEKIKQVQSLIGVKSAKYQEKIKKLEQQLKSSMMKLKRESRRQINEIVSVQIELKRKFDEILWIQKFLSYNQELLDAQSNIRLKELSAEYTAHANTEDYFRRIEQKIAQLKQNP